MTIATCPTLTAGGPDVAGPLAVFPLFGPAPRLEYVSFAEACAQGARVTELPAGASVNDLLVHNPLKVPVLLYEGEELLGAQQNRTVDAAVLVPAASDLEIAVSCVEHGRWDGSRHGDAFAPSPQAAYPGLRAAKSARMRERLAAGLDARADQGEVWQNVDLKVSEVAAPSATGAMGDAFDHRRDGVEAMRARIHRHDGQIGTLVAIGGRFVVLDHVSRADVFAALHGPLVSGYALDALSHPGGTTPSTAEAATFLATVATARMVPAPSAGLGQLLRLEHGTGLEVEGELVQLSVFAADTPRAHRIRRPSRRG
jgi:hypothetical protein